MEKNENSQVDQIKQPLTAKSLFNQDNVKTKFEEMLGKKAQGFITSVLQIVASSHLLSQADPASIYNCAMVAATLDLPLNNNLGFAYIIPFKQKYQEEGQWKTKVVAQFQIGYKGFIQLSQRSGQFKTISAAAIYEGQLIESNPLTGFRFDFSKKESDKIIGYASYFQLLNGFEKTLYMTAGQLNAHGKKFSQTFKGDTGLWKDDFENMAQKTVLKLLLSKFAPLSIEMQRAVITDQAMINDEKGESLTYIDHEDVTAVVIDKEADRMQKLINECTSTADLFLLQQKSPDVDVKLFDKRKEEILNGSK